MSLKFHSLVLCALFLVKVVQWRIGSGTSPAGKYDYMSALAYVLPFVALLTAILLARDKFNISEAVRMSRAAHSGTSGRRVFQVLSFGIGTLLMVGIIAVALAPEQVLHMIKSNYSAGLEQHQVATAWRQHWSLGLLAYGTTLLIAPVLEELYYRGLLLNHWSAKQRMGTAIVGSSMIFVAAHIHIEAGIDLLALIHIGAGSLLYCYAYLRIGLVAAVAMHMLVNAWSSTLILLAKTAELMIIE